MSRATDSKVEDAIASADALSSCHLDLSHGEITNLPAQLLEAEPLLNLQVSLSIPISAHSETYYFLLQRLYLAGNRLKVLPEALFSVLPNLKWLDLRQNCLTSLPVSIIKLQ